MSPRRRRAVSCKYLTFYDPRLDIRFRLPLVHIRIRHGDIALRTDALIDSGATCTFIPLDLIEVLGIDPPEGRHDAVGAGGVFPVYHINIDLIEVLKGRTAFCELRNIEVKVPANRGVIPHTVLGRDGLFRSYDITFREEEKRIIFRGPKF